MTKLPQALSTLMEHLKKLPGVGYKTAERYAFELLNWDEKNLEAFAIAIKEMKNKICFCSTCHCLMDVHCPFCDNPMRSKTSICVIEKPMDVFYFEKTGSYQGVYHALGGLLNPLSFKSESTLNLDSLLERLNEDTHEVILALDATLEGEATSLLIQEKLKKEGLIVSRLAYGIPIGSPLNYVDGGTLSRALALRSRL